MSDLSNKYSFVSIVVYFCHDCTGTDDVIRL